MRLAYVSVDYSNLQATRLGVFNKVNAQIGCFVDQGFDCELVEVPKSTKTIAKIRKRLPLVTGDEIWDDVSLDGFNAAYIRRPNFDQGFINWLKRERLKNRNLLIVMELPTYPYDDEMKNPRDWLMLFKDRSARKSLSAYINRIAVMTPNDKVFGIPTLRITNGVDLSKYSTRDPLIREPGCKKLEIACAARFAFWHGYDRLLNGVADYYNNAGDWDVRIHMMGDGPELENYKSIAKNRGISERVEFYGMLNSVQMDEVYELCDIACSCLACHRKGLHQVSSLKSREYLAKGMPFVHSNVIDIFESNPVDFCLKVPEDETPVSINEILSFLTSLNAKYGAENVPQVIRAYANENVGMDFAMKEVIEYLRSHDGV